MWLRSVVLLLRIFGAKQENYLHYINITVVMFLLGVYGLIRLYLEGKKKTASGLPLVQLLVHCYSNKVDKQSGKED